MVAKLNPDIIVTAIPLKNVSVTSGIIPHTVVIAAMVTGKRIINAMNNQMLFTVSPCYSLIVSKLE